MRLSPRQQQVLDFISRHIVSHGYPPTLREIGRAMGIKSTNAVTDHLRALERKGAIVRDRSRSRSITIVGAERAGGGERAAQARVPVLGRIAAGIPLLAEENIEGSLAVDRRFLAGNGGRFALRVVGDSMIEAGIFDGDILLVRAQGVAPQGAIVVALIDNEATVKRFYREEGRIRLQPANREMSPIYLSPDEGRETSIQGVVTAVFRQLEA